MYSLFKTPAIVLLVFLSLASEIIFAQNYEAINTNANSYFYDSVAMDVNVIRIDSVASTGTLNQYFGMRQIRPTDYSCYIPDGGSWLGDVVTENTSGVYQFIVYPFSPGDSADVFTIKSNALTGENWHFYNYHFANNYIEATVAQVNTSNFIGISDSVKTIILQRKDASGQNISDPVNGQKILLSKHYGLIRLPKFDEFKSNLRFLDICGKTEPVAGRTNLTFEQIFDFQPGDEFHIAFDNSPYTFWYPYESGFIIQHILERINGTNTDTVSYKIAECKTSTYSQGMGQTTITNTSDTVITKFIKSNYTVFAFEPKEPQLIENWPYELTENQMGLSATGVLFKTGIPWTLTNATWPLWGDETQQCWNYAMIDDFGNSAYYYKGLGGPYHYYWGIITGNFKKLVYYKKGTETWGTPLSCDSILQVGLPELKKISEISIYPNPSSGNITISVPERFSLPGELELFDISGRKVIQGSISQHQQTVDLSIFPAGLYSFKLTSSNGEIFRGKVIRK
jgi:hypothetical protein